MVETGLGKVYFNRKRVLEKALHTEVTALAKAQGQAHTGKLRDVQVMESG